jgi:hypothetical protein
MSMLSNSLTLYLTRSRIGEKLVELMNHARADFLGAYADIFFISPV